MASECPKFLDLNPSSLLVGHSRSLLAAALAASTLSLIGCSDDADESFPPPPKGWGCVSVLDQKDKAMTDCTFSYKLPPEAKVTEPADAATSCKDGELYIYGSPRLYRINGECKKGKLAGYVEADIEEGANTTYKTRLIDSLCTDELIPEANPSQKVVALNDHLGSSTATHCGNFLTNHQLEKIEVVGICKEETVATPTDAGTTANTGENDGGTEGGVDGSTDSENSDGGNEAASSTSTYCNPTSAHNYLIPMGNPGEYSEGKPLNLTFMTGPELVAAGESVTIKVTLRQMEGSQQEIEVPIIIHGASTPDAGSDSGSKN